MPNHLLGHGGLGNMYAKLREFAVQAGRSPQRIGSTHVPDQFAHFQSDARSTRPTSAALPCPVALEPGAVPPDNRLGFHDEENAVPVRPGSAQEHPEAPVDIREPRPLRRTLQDGELLPESEILKRQRAARCESRDERAEKQPNHDRIVMPAGEKDQR